MFYSILGVLALCTLYIINTYKNTKEDVLRKNSIGISVIALLISLSVIGLTKLIVDSSFGGEKEYRGTLILKSEYYEYWSTWVTRTCSREVPCGVETYTDANGRTTTTTKYCTEYYDCSYCDEHDAYWIVKDDLGKEYKISEQKYKELAKQWSSIPKFVDLNRKINKRLGCGVDGDKYEIYWDNQIKTSEAYNHRVHYINKGKNKSSSFSYRKVTEEEKRENNLFDYPEYYEYNKQKSVLGIEKLGLNNIQLDTISKYYEYLNGIGTRTHCKVFVLLFPDQKVEIAKLQERYWEGGHRNEMVICIGYNPSNMKLDWVYPFSWTNNKRILVDLREDIMQIDTLDLMQFFPIIKTHIETQFKPKDINEFAYVKNDYSIWLYIFLWVITLGITISIFIIYEKNK